MTTWLLTLTLLSLCQVFHFMLIAIWEGNYFKRVLWELKIGSEHAMCCNLRCPTLWKAAIIYCFGYPNQSTKFPCPRNWQKDLDMVLGRHTVAAHSSSQKDGSNTEKKNTVQLYMWPIKYLYLYFTQTLKKICNGCILSILSHHINCSSAITLKNPQVCDGWLIL